MHMYKIEYLPTKTVLQLIDTFRNYTPFEIQPCAYIKRN